MAKIDKRWVKIYDRCESTQKDTWGKGKFSYPDTNTISLHDRDTIYKCTPACDAAIAALDWYFGRAERDVWVFWPDVIAFNPDPAVHIGDQPLLEPFDMTPYLALEEFGAF